MKKSRLAIAAVGVASLALAGCSGASDGEGDLEEVTLAVLGPGSLQWLHAIAIEQGYYEEHGVEVEELQVQNSGALVQAVTAGSADAGIALGDSVIRAVDEGAGITITGALIHRPALRIYGAPGVDSLDDLEGAQVTAGATEGGTFDLLLWQLQEADVDTTTLTPVAISNSSDRVVALENGQVQGALLIPPFDYIAAEAGASELGWYRDYWLETPAIVNDAWAAENPGAAAGFTRGLAEAAAFFAEEANRESVVETLVEYASVEPPAAEAAWEFIHSNDIFSPDLRFPDEALENVAAISAEVAGEELEGFEASDYYDLSYLDE